MNRSLLLYIFLAVVFGASVAIAQAKPLMTIRFNSDVVAYDQNLGKAVKMALDAKPDVFFDIVVISPETSDKSLSKKLDAEAKTNAAKIAEKIEQSGVSANMVRTSYQKNNSVRSNEVQIFVQ